MKEKKEKNKEKDYIENADLDKALKYNRFQHLLIETRKYKDFFWSKEALFSLCIALISTYLMKTVASSNLSRALEMAEMLIPSFIGGMLTILALSLTGLAIVTSTLGEKFITIITKHGKLYSVLGILFNFYFAGFVIGITIVSLTFTYITMSISKPFNDLLYIILAFVNSYLVFFSVIYSIMLLGTCIRMFLVKYAVEKKFNKE